MSQIAQALAKAKERTGHTTAPFMVPGSVAVPPLDTERAAASAAAIKRAQLRQRFWIGLVVVALPLTVFICWIQIRNGSAASAAETATASSSSAVAASPEAAGSGSLAGKGTGKVIASSGGARPGADASRGGTAAQNPETLQLVGKLSISAVMPGDPPRIMLAGRVVLAGQPIEGGLVFAGIADGFLRFTDANGVVYTRHY